MAKSSTPAEGIDALGPAIQALGAVYADYMDHGLQTAEDLLKAARIVADAARSLDRATTAATADLPTPAVTALVLAARKPPKGDPATWKSVSLSMGQSTAQRAHDHYSPGKLDRLRQTQERSYSHRRPQPPRQLPGMSMAEAAEALGVSRHTVKAWSQPSDGKAAKLHAWPATDEDGNVLQIARAGKSRPAMRIHLTGQTLAEAAAETGLDPAAVEALGEQGKISRAPMLDDEHRVMTDSEGRGVYWYWPDHIQVGT
ncbi:helix-turn-helix domain-containing protein [Specibacter sp. RAF43]|uniref:helix-turn-helix domain-containing protein n=1 Tax=Specibacter sp. RAF43 TaxID=3233057 RepID=UPI003F989235